jgi:hypothetical protein
MTDYRDEVCRSPIDGPTHPIISFHQQQRAQRFAHNAPAQSANRFETVGDRVMSLERQVDDLKAEVEKLKQGKANVHD